MYTISLPSSTDKRSYAIKGVQVQAVEVVERWITGTSVCGLWPVVYGLCGGMGNGQGGPVKGGRLGYQNLVQERAGTS
jgi:hypothetical protein